MTINVRSVLAAVGMLAATCLAQAGTAHAGSPELATTGAGIGTAGEAVQEGDWTVIQMYAPYVWLSRSEKYTPVSADSFVARSSLWWAHDKCKDDKDAGRVDPYRLGSGGYSHQIANALCNDHGVQHHSNKLSRPRQDGKDGIPSREGFYLNLPNNLRGGHGTRAPAYYEYVAHQYVTYWFFYAHNDGPAEPTALFDHEGDWERISVRLDKKNRATAIAYYQHEGYCTRTWTDAGKHAGHPLAYSALGTHATYPWLGGYEIAGGLAFDVTGRGAGWPTYARLTNARDHGWFGFAGAWGEVGESSDTTGPLGPGAPTKDPAPAPNDAAWYRPCTMPTFRTSTPAADREAEQDHAHVNL